MKIRGDCKFNTVLVRTADGVGSVACSKERKVRDCERKEFQGRKQRMVTAAMPDFIWNAASEQTHGAAIQGGACLFSTLDIPGFPGKAGTLVRRKEQSPLATIEAISPPPGLISLGKTAITTGQVSRRILGYHHPFNV
jgi:hypothetical protein